MTIEELKALFETGKEITQEMFETLIDELQSKDGEDGKSAYDIAVEGGFEGDEEDWLNSLKGESGEDGDKGDTGATGDDGKSAYEVAVYEESFEGTVQDWLESLKGDEGEKGNPGQDGNDGFGTEEQYNALVSRIESLEGTLEEPEEPED